jgi:hypothetical protein
MLLAGSDAKLSEFEAAARKCGFSAMERVPDGDGGQWIRVAGPITWIAKNPAYGCAVSHISRNPDGLYFVGNKAWKD